jgi:hypothetical protein
MLNNSLGYGCFFFAYTYYTDKKIVQISFLGSHLPPLVFQLLPFTFNHNLVYLPDHEIQTCIRL